MKQALEAVVSYSDEDEISGLATCLKAKAGAGELDEGGALQPWRVRQLTTPWPYLSADEESSLF